MALKKVAEMKDGSFGDSGISHLTNQIPIQTLKPLEELSKELSELYKKPVEVVDILEEGNFEEYHSLITGKEYDTFLNGEYNNAQFKSVLVNTNKALNAEKTKNNIYQTYLIFKEK
jgi:hypothetical protein